MKKPFYKRAKCLVQAVRTGGHARRTFPVGGMRKEWQCLPRQVPHIPKGSQIPAWRCQVGDPRPLASCSPLASYDIKTNTFFTFSPEDDEPWGWGRRKILLIKGRVQRLIHSSRKCFKYYVLGVVQGQWECSPGYKRRHNPCPTKNACELLGMQPQTYTNKHITSLSWPWSRFGEPWRSPAFTRASGRSPMGLSAV